MDGTESVKLTLGGQQYNFRFTLERIKEVNERTGKGLVQLELEAHQLHYGSLEMLVWAGLAHPGNPKLKNATVADTSKLFTLKDTRAITAGLRAALEAAMTEDNPDATANPPQPIALGKIEAA